MDTLFTLATLAAAVRLAIPVAVDPVAVVPETVEGIKIVHDDDATSHTRAREVGAAYKRRFDQEAVLVARAPTIQCLYASRG